MNIFCGQVILFGFNSFDSLFLIDYYYLWLELGVKRELDA